MMSNQSEWPRESHRPSDEEPTVMGMEERSAWVQVFAFAITTGAYLVVVLPEVSSKPIDDVDWVVPLLWALGISILTVIIGSIIAGVGGAIGLTKRGLNVDSELASDSRDKDIARHARLRTYWVMPVLAMGALILAMLDVDTFWIGTFIFVIATIGAIADAVVRIRAYRRGFVG